MDLHIPDQPASIPTPELGLAKERKSVLRRYLITGLAALLPTLVTAFVFFTLWRYAQDTIGNRMVDALVKALGMKEANTALVVAGSASALLIFIAAAMLLGLFLTSFLGNRLFKSIEHSFGRLPVISSIYKPIRQVTDFFLTEKQQFRSVVAIEYPRKGMYSIGFVTSSGFKDVVTPDGRRMVSVFIPSSPTPFTGYVMLVSESELIQLPIAIDDAIRFTVSGGVIRPSNQIAPDEIPYIPPSPIQSE